MQGVVITFVILLIIIALVIITSCVKIVPQAQAYVVERLGGWLDTWTVGLHFKAPLLTALRKK